MSESAESNSRGRPLLWAFGSLLWAGVLFWGWRIWSDRQSVDRPQSRQLPAPNAPTFQPWELPDFQLIDQHGTPVTRTDLQGRPWVACFTFTRCTRECPIITKKLASLLDAVKDTNVRVVSISVDPKHDTPAVLQRHAKTHRTPDKRFLFLTGPETVVYALLKTGFKVNAIPNTAADRKPGSEVSHSQRVLHIDAAGRVIGTYRGTSDDDIERLRVAIKRK